MLIVLELGVGVGDCDVMLVDEDEDDVILDGEIVSLDCDDDEIGSISEWILVFCVCIFILSGSNFME